VFLCLQKPKKVETPGTTGFPCAAGDGRKPVRVCEMDGAGVDRSLPYLNERIERGKVCQRRETRSEERAGSRTAPRRAGASHRRHPPAPRWACCPVREAEEHALGEGPAESNGSVPTGSGESWGRTKAAQYPRRQHMTCRRVSSPTIREDTRRCGLARFAASPAYAGGIRTPM